MSIEEKVGQIFFVRCPDMYSIEDVDTYHLGGYILFDRDFKDQNYQDVVAKMCIRDRSMGGKKSIGNTAST